ncbi:MAG: choice-of-anchor Q domain-containing protein, partial [Bacteroidota bacterium]
MKKSFLIFFLILLSGWARAAFDDGDGTSSDPYLVSTAAQLNDVRNYLSSYFLQTADIDLSAYSTDPGWVPIGDATTKFTGSYDGGGHKIKKLYINRTGVQYQGLFGYTSSATIKNLGVEVNIYSNTTNVGGLAGYAKATNISKCYTKGSIIGYNYTAGLIGQAVGSPAFSQGLNGPESVLMTLTDCYSRASVSGNYYVGGIIGDASQITFTNCYATGDVYSSQATTKGGLVGRSLSTGTVTSCYWDTETSGLAVSAIGTGKTTAEMKTQATFTNWNFSVSPIIWNIDSDNSGYPHLNWQVFTHNKYYVKKSGNDANAGTSWGAAFLTFQKALATATGGDQIWIAAGTYKPSVEVGGTGARYAAFQMIDEVEIYGGFSGSESSVSERANFGMGLANETILSGDLNGNDNYAVTPWTGTGENCYRVIYDKNLLTRLTPAAILDGFTVKGGWGNQYGGGMIVEDCSPTLRNLIVINNHTYAGGGGIYTWRGTTKCSPVLINCLFVNNLSNSGAGVWNRASSPVFSNVTIANNAATADGGGMWNGMGAAPVLNNCLIWGNTGGSSSTGKQLYADGTITLNYSCYSNAANDNYGTMAATSCITTDPQFADAVAKDYRIAGNSPCADAGNDVYNILTTDIRGSGFGRKLLKTDANSTGTIDMGAYEYKSGIDPPTPCINPTTCGTIAENQTGSNPFDPAAFTSTAAPTGYSGTLEYKWQVSTASSSTGFSEIASSNAETYNPGPITQTSWYKRIAHVSCKADWTGAVESNVLTMTVMPTLTWNGSVSTNWNTAANWNLSTVPASLNNVIIPDVTNDPVVNQVPGSPAVCNNLMIETGAVLTIASVKALTVNGIVTNSAGISGLVIESGASMIQNGANVSATVKRDITAGASLWHLFISPVTQSIQASASSCFDGAYLD